MTVVEHQAEALRDGRRAPPAERAKKILVLADAACATESICAGIRRHVNGGDAEVLIVAPAHPSFLHGWTADDDEATADAERRLRTSAACLGRLGFAATAVVGDADPTQAVADELRRFPADEIVVLTRRDERSGLFHRALADRIRGRFRQAVTHIVVSEAVAPSAKA